MFSMNERLAVLRELEETERRNLRGSGMHLLKDFSSLPEGYASNPFLCPFGMEGYCEGIKDPDYKGRCKVDDPKDLLKCSLYNDFIANPDLYIREKPKIDTNADTASIRHDDVIKMSRRQNNFSRRIDASLHDRIADGETPEKFFRFGETIRDSRYETDEPI